MNTKINNLRFSFQCSHYFLTSLCVYNKHKNRVCSISDKKGRDVVMTTRRLQRILFCADTAGKK